MSELGFALVECEVCSDEIVKDSCYTEVHSTLPTCICPKSTATCFIFVHVVSHTRDGDTPQAAATRTSDSVTK